MTELYDHEREEVADWLRPSFDAIIAPALTGAFLDGIDTEHEAHQRKLRTAGVVAVVSLAVLQVADLILTARFRHYGLQEGNGLMAPLLNGPLPALIKGGIVAALGVSLYRKPRLGLLCGVWAAVGYYTLACYVNWAAVQMIAR